MGKLEYYKLLSMACFGQLGEVTVDDLCQKYCREGVDKAGYLLAQQFKKMSSDDVAHFLKVYGLKLWQLYFNTVGKKPYGIEIEKILIFGSSQEVFEQITHAFDADGEKLLVEMQKLHEAPDDNFVSNKVEWYLAHFALSFEALLQLIEQTKQDQTNKQQGDFHLLEIAVQTLAESSKPNALASVETQLKVLELSQDKDLIFNLLHYFDMANLPDAKVVQRLVEINYLPYLRELLAHSCVRECKKMVYQAFPTLKTEILLSELGYAAYRQSKVEQHYFNSFAYQKNVQGCHSHYTEDNNPLYGDEVIPMLQICMELYSNEVKTQEARCEWIKKAIAYCKYNQNVSDLVQAVPLLEKLLAEEKKK